MMAPPDPLPSSTIEWLQALGLVVYAQAFEQHHIEPELLAHLTTDDLRDMGIPSVGHRKRLEQAISRLKAPIGLVAALPNAAGSDITTAAPATIVAAKPANSDAELESRDATAFRPMKLFLSYGRDALVPEVRALKQALEARGHEVWFDEEQLTGGLDWEQRIEAGLGWCDRVVLTMTPHSVRRPDGYCLNELAKALERQKPIIPVLLSDVPNGAPTSICRIQYLDWRDAVPAAEKPERFAARLERLAQAIEQDKLDFEGGQQRLLRALQPLNYTGDIDRHVVRFTGRTTLFARLRHWLDDPVGTQVVWLCGGSGLGKSAIAAMLAHRWGETGAVHFCVAGHLEKADPRRAILSIAYQLSTKIDEYRSRLAALDLEKLVDKDARTLFDALLVTPFTGQFPTPAQPWMVVVDALDEANTADGQNELAELLGQEWRKLPGWLRLLVGSQPDGEVRTWLADATVLNLTASDPGHRADLAAFLREGLARQGRQEADEVMDRIIERSEGAFQYVVLLIEEIRQGRCDPRDAIALPRGMQAAYLQAFKRRFPDAGVYAAHFRPLLDLVLASPDPVPVAVLASAFGIAPLEARRRLAAMGSMLALQPAEETRDPAWDTVRFAQSSLRNWLTAIDEHTRQPVASGFACDLDDGLRVLTREVLQRWDDAQSTEREPDGYVARTLFDLLTRVGLTSELDRVAPALARHWLKRSISRAWPIAQHARRWSDRVVAEGQNDPAVLRRVAEARLVFGRVAAARGESDLALQSIRSAQGQFQALLKQTATDSALCQFQAECHQECAKLIRSQGDLAGAMKEQCAAVEILQRLHDGAQGRREVMSELASAINLLGNMLNSRGELGQALTTYRRAEVLREQLVGLDPANRSYRRDLGGSRNNIGIVLRAQGDLEGALNEYRRFREIVQSLHEEEPLVQEWRRVLSISHYNTSIILEVIGRLNEAVAEARRCIVLRAQLVAEEPDNLAFQRYLADSHGRVGRLLQAQDALEEALEHNRSSLKVGQFLVSRDSTNTAYQQSVADAYGDIGSVIQAQGKVREAIVAFESTMEILERLLSLNPNNPLWQLSLAIQRRNMAISMRDAGRMDEALVWSERAISLSRNLVSRGEKNATWQKNLAHSLRTQAELLHAVQRLPLAQASAKESLDIRETLAAQAAGNFEYQETLALALCCLGSVLVEQGDMQHAEPALLRARDLMVALVAKDPERADWLDVLSDIHREIGWMREHQGQWAQALLQHREDLKISQSIVTDATTHVNRRRDLAMAHLNIGWCLLTAGDPQGALEALEIAVVSFNALTDPQRPGSLVDHAGALALRTEALKAAGITQDVTSHPTDTVSGEWRAVTPDSAIRRRLVSRIAAALA